MQLSLSSVCVLLTLFCSSVVAGTDRPWFPVLENEEAWKLLPPTTTGSRKEPLPVWARIFVEASPATTAAMLEMDRVQRSENPLPPRLRAKIRWIAARANGCLYSESIAAADFARAGGAGELPQATAHLDSTEKEQRVVVFAQLMCEAANEVTDDQFRALLDDWGPELITAVVLTLANANFQDRLFLMLGLEAAGADTASPVAARFDWPSLKAKPLKAPQRQVPDPPQNADLVPVRVADADWSAAPLEQLKQRLQHQQLRAPRIPIPPDDVVERQIPRELVGAGRSSRVKWNSMTFGYQPKLAVPWMITMRRFREESALPDSFRQSVFWVVTRSNWCFY